MAIFVYAGEGIHMRKFNRKGKKKAAEKHKPKFGRLEIFVCCLVVFWVWFLSCFRRMS